MSEARIILGLARREARERARSRGFRISTIILVLGAALAVFVPAIVADGDGTRVVGTLDAPDGLVEAARTTAPADLTLQFEAYADRAAAEEALGGAVDVVVVGDDGLLWSDGADERLETALTAALSRLALLRRAGELEVSAADLSALLQPADITSRSLQPQEGIADSDHGPRAVITVVGVVLLFVSVTFYGSYILLSVIEEKQNRVVEVLLAHVRPRDLLAGKVLGHGLLGLTQMSLIALVAVIGLAVTDPIEVPSAGYGAIVGVVLWFVLGFAFYSILYGALGSLASRTEDAQSAVGPLTGLLMVAYFATFTIIDNPSGLVALVGSFLPPTAPLMMPVRTALTDVAAWQVALAVGIELMAIAALVWLGGRLYRGAVLRIGPKVSLRDAWRATG